MFATVCILPFSSHTHKPKVHHFQTHAQGPEPDPSCMGMIPHRQVHALRAQGHRFRLTHEMQATESRVAGSRKGSILNRVSLAGFQSSTKIEALREELERMKQRDPSAKAIVFSQFTSMLDLIYYRLQQVLSFPTIS